MTDERSISPAAAAFRALLSRGSGRAALLLQQDPANVELNAELLRACIENLTHDRELEESRATYLHRLIRMTGRATAYRTALEARLRAVDIEDVVVDFGQIFEVLSRLIADEGGDQDILRDFVLTTRDRSAAMAGAWELVRLQGLDALLACAHRFSDEIVQEPWLIGSLVRELEERDGEKAVAIVLEEARKADAEFDRLMSLHVAARTRPESGQKDLTYEMLKAEINQGTRSQFPLQWIRQATEVEIELAASDLLAEDDDEGLLAYLRIFSRRRFPRSPERLLPLLDRSNLTVAHRAAYVLGQIRDAQVRIRGLELIAEGRAALGLKLLHSSYEAEDLPRFRPALDSLQADANDLHWAAGGLIDMIETMADLPPEPHAILLHVYDVTPCSICRARVVDLLAERSVIPDWMAEEGRYDAESTIASRFAVRQDAQSPTLTATIAVT